MCDTFQRYGEKSYCTLVGGGAWTPGTGISANHQDVLFTIFLVDIGAYICDWVWLLPIPNYICYVLVGGFGIEYGVSGYHRIDICLKPDSIVWQRGA